MYNWSQPRMYRRPEPTRADLYAALQRSQQENQHLRHRLSQRRADDADIGQLREAVARLRAENARLRDRNARLQGEHEQLSASVSALREENAQLSAAPPQKPEPVDASERVLRLSADIANLRRRQAEEVDRARRSARARLLREFVESLDVLERALDSHPDPESAWHKGTDGVRRKMLATLTQAGVERLGAVGEVFDPRIHEAVGLDPTGSVPAEHIARVMQPGYRFTDTQIADALIRPARVIVSG